MAISVVLAVLPVQAQEPAPISTDSPTISRSSHVVGKGVVVLEANYNITSTRDGQPSVQSLPLVLHAGVSDQFELRLETNSLTWQGSQRGLADVALGFRYEFQPNWGIVGLVTLPSGSADFRTAAAVPFVSFNHDQPLSEEDGLLFNLGVSWLPNAQTQGLATVVYSRMVGEDVSWFLETALVGSEVRLDTGVQVWTSADFVVNLAVLHGLSGGGQDWGGTIGFGTRY